MEEPKKDINRYKCLRLLGEGSFGKAYLVLCSDQVDTSLISDTRSSKDCISRWFERRRIKRFFSRVENT